VHSACAVYIALPSASRLSTLRAGHATAAPVASGMPCPIAPPVRHIQVCGGAPAHSHGTNSPAVLPSSATIAPSGRSAPSVRATDSAFSAPVGKSGRCAACASGLRGAAPTASTNASSAPTASCAGVASTCAAQPLGNRSLGLSGYAKNETGALLSTTIKC